MNKRRKQHNGYVYLYINEQFEHPIEIKNTKGRKTGQFDLDGKLIKVFKSTEQAGKELRIPSRNIRLVCEGKRNKCHNFIWRYLD